jgi:hypothetical protein
VEKCEQKNERKKGEQYRAVTLLLMIDDLMIY